MSCKREFYSLEVFSEKTNILSSIHSLSSFSSLFCCFKKYFPGTSTSDAGAYYDSLDFCISAVINNLCREILWNFYS